MAGRNNPDNRLFIQGYLLLFLVLLTASGCVIPVVAVNDWPVPANYKPYLPPDEKDDVLLICIYDKNQYQDIADDVQILSYPYNKARFKRTYAIGLMGSVGWAAKKNRGRVAILLFTKKGRVIYIPLRPYRAYDNALTYFHAMDAPPLQNNDFLSYEDHSYPYQFYFFAAPSDYAPEIFTRPNVEYRWGSLESAKMASGSSCSSVWTA